MADARLLQGGIRRAESERKINQFFNSTPEDHWIEEQKSSAADLFKYQANGAVHFLDAADDAGLFDARRL